MLIASKPAHLQVARPGSSAAAAGTAAAAAGRPPGTETALQHASAEKNTNTFAARVF